jgi:sec-independent protein translocase protein TatB|tara:strand:- start:1 stop:246 length:246 start_codon:yes stop_codon:yes gene_type:complete
MPQIGWLEILIIVSIAIIVIGPKDFPIMLKKVGSWVGSIKRYVSNVQNEVASIDDEAKSIYDNNEEKIDQKNNIKKNNDVK